MYCATAKQCQNCPQKKRCTPGSFRTLVVHWEEPAREAVRALAGTPAYVRSQRERGKIEALFSELKQRFGLRRVRLYAACGTWQSSSYWQQQLRTSKG